MPADRVDPVALLSTWASGSLDDLLAAAPRVTVRAGDYLFHQGEASDGLYVVSSGRLEVVIDHPNSVLTVVTRGAVLGELGVLTDSPRAASVRAKRDSELIKISRDVFLDLLEQDPRFAASLARSLGRDLQASRPRVAPEQDPLPRTIAVVALGSDSPTQPVAKHLIRSLARFGTIDSLQAASRDSHDDAALARELDDRERQHDRVLLVAEASDSASWRAFCIRGADRVLVLASERTPVPSGSLQLELTGCDLVRCGSGAVPSAGWVDALQPRAIYTLAAHSGVDRAIAVMARRLAGRSVGLVFSGGAARGAAHIGVVEVLAAAGVVVDRVAGASIGALAAGAFAAGMSAQEMAGAWHRNMIAVKPLNDYTVPAVALVRGAKFRAGLQREFGSMQIEDLTHEFFCVSADIQSSELYVHRRGPLVDAIYASMAIPGLLPPANVDGRILVDGGVLNNLPVDTLARRGEGPVVASELTVQGFHHRYAARSSDLGWHARLRSALRTGVTGVKGPAPRLRDTLMRVLVLASVDATRAARDQADVVIAPKTRGIGMMEFTAIDRAIEAGREAALAALAQPGTSERLLLD